MKYIKYNWLLIAILSFSMSSCFNLDEEVFDRVDSSIYYQNENSVKAAVASIYSNGALSYIEYFWDMMKERSLFFLHIHGHLIQRLSVQHGKLHGPRSGYVIRCLLT